MEEKSRFTVVFADRDPEWSGPLAVQLRREGARVWVHHAARDLLDGLVGRDADVLVLDEELGETGVDGLLRQVRERDPSVSILLIHPGGTPAPHAEDPGVGVLRRFCRSVPHSLLLDVLHWSRDHRGRPLLASRPRVVLCVDDESFYLDSLSRILRRHGYCVIACSSPEESLESIPSVNPDLAFVDILMPGMNGLDLAEEIREIHGDAFPIVFLSARGSDAEIMDGYRHGACYYITKPCDPRTVLNIADYLLAELDPLERKLLEAQL